MRKSIAAGVLIAMAAYLYVLQTDVIGAALFGFGLCMVCLFELDLFTGKIGYFGALNLPYLKILLGNLIGCALVCLALRVNPAGIESAIAIAEKKAALSWSAALVNGFFCGVLMYVAVASWKKGLRSGCFLCVTVFILCRFEHSIADFSYMALAWVWSVNLIWIVLGNALGAVAARMLIGPDTSFSLSLRK